MEAVTTFHRRRENPDHKEDEMKLCPFCRGELTNEDICYGVTFGSCHLCLNLFPRDKVVEIPTKQILTKPENLISFPQIRAKMEDEGYKLISRPAPREVIVQHPNGVPELWICNDRFSGFVLVIGRWGYEFVSEL